MKRSSLAVVGLVVSLALVAAPASGAPAQTPKRGGTVVVATNALAEPNCLGWLEICDPLGRAAWLEKVLARPFVAEPDRLRNHLIERYELTTEPFTVTFRIRPEARWSDGVPVSAGDFVFAFNRYLAPGGYPDDHDLRSKIRGVRAVDAAKVRFDFRARYGDWRWLLNFPPLPRHALRGADLGSTSLWRNRIDDPRTGRPIGSGPFLIGQWEPGTQVTLIRNPRYWGRHTSHLERIVLRFERDSARALRAGEVDLGVVLPPAPEFESDKRFTLRSTRWSVEHYQFRVRHPSHPALEDKLVRRALAYGIDRAAIARGLFGSAAPPVLHSTMYKSSDRSYEPNWKVYRYRPDQARRLLEQAGCSRDDEIYSCAGERMRLRFFTTAGSALRERSLEIVARQLRRIGVEVETRYAPNLALFNTVLPSGEWDAVLLGYSNDIPEQVYSAFSCGRSYTGYCNRLVNADSDQLDRIVYPSRREAVANRIDKRLAADVPTLPLFEVPITYVVRKGLEGVVPNGFGPLTTGGTLWNAENWWLDD